jgi:hypothetical protein
MGIRMRSRLEAAFASMLDGEGFTWTYEPRVFADRRGQYLPDFQIVRPDDLPMFIEVKPTDEAAELACERMEIILASEPEAVLVVAVPLGDYIGGELDFDYLTLQSGEWSWVGTQSRDWTAVDAPRTYSIESVKEILPRVYDLLDEWYATAHRRLA